MNETRTIEIRPGDLVFVQWHAGLMTGPGPTTMCYSNAESLDEVLELFENFLLGCGYLLKGHLEIVEAEDGSA